MSSTSVSSWCDITVDNATELAEFYQKVMGWTCQKIDMGDYADYVMMNKAGEPAGGICHARGGNAYMPPGWLHYFTVEDLAASLTQVIAHGGEQVGEVRHCGKAQYCVIRDPGGAHCALYSSGE